MKLIRESQYISFEGKREFDEVFPLIRKYDALGPNARRLLLALADRLVKGVEHGDFDKPHDWDRESAEEALDLAVYQAAKLLGLGKAEESTAGLTFKEALKRATSPYFTWGHWWGYWWYDSTTGAQVCDTNGRTIDGKPWVPPPGAQVRVVYRMYDDVEPFTGEVIIIHRARKYDDDKIVVDVNGFSRLMRVVPA